MKQILMTTICLILVFASCRNRESQVLDYKVAQDDSIRINRMLGLKWGMFLHWSLGTVSGNEWTKGITTPDYFTVSGINTDQWCRVAREAGMGYIIFVAKHHDGFCLWDTKTTLFKVTNSPLKKDVLFELRKSCDKYGIKLCLYFSEADWTWPDFKNAEMKIAQITELFTQYGEIPLVWMDVAQWDGGLGHVETEELIRKYQPNCLIGFNHGLPAGDLQSREMGTFDKLVKSQIAQKLNKEQVDSLVKLNEKYVMDLNWSEAGNIEKILINNYDRYKVAECAVCINQINNTWYWFYNDATKDNAISADQILEMYNKAVDSKVLFSLATGPDKKGELREVDIIRLLEVGKSIGVKK
jgi:alpha-L-fucosidase